MAIKKELHLKPSLPEDKIKWLYNRFTTQVDVARSLLNSVAIRGQERYKDIMWTLTNENKSFGYYISNPNELAHLTNALYMLDAKNVCDLGCGCFIGMHFVNQALQHMNKYGITFHGIELDDRLIELANSMFHGHYHIQKADLLTITSHNIGKYDTLYAYEPIKEQRTAIAFAKNLVGAMHHNQVFILNPAGYMYNAIENTKKFDHVQNTGSLRWYRLK